MMEFSNLIQVSLVGGSQKTFQFLADTFTFEPSVTEENGGTYWDCGKTFTVDMPEDLALIAFKIPRRAIVIIKGAGHDSAKRASESFQIGTTGIPARVQLVKHLNKASLIVRCKMLTNPLG